MKAFNRILLAEDNPKDSANLLLRLSTENEKLSHASLPTFHSFGLEFGAKSTIN